MEWIIIQERKWRIIGIALEIDFMSSFISRKKKRKKRRNLKCNRSLFSLNIIPPMIININILSIKWIVLRIIIMEIWQNLSLNLKRTEKGIIWKSWFEKEEKIRIIFKCVIIELSGHLNDQIRCQMCTWIVFYILCNVVVCLLSLSLFVGIIIHSILLTN